MIPREIAKRYARALFESALKEDIAVQLRDEGQGFIKLLAENRDFGNFLLSPQVMTEDKKSLLDKALKGQASDLLLRFLHLLIDKQRFAFVEEILAAYSHLYDQHEGIIEARVITAIPLEEYLKERIKEKIENETGKKVVVAPETDPEILGGAILIMGDKIIDGSIRYQMEKMKRGLRELKVSAYES